MKASHKPLSAYRIISLSSCILHFIAFLLFLLVALSSTIIKPIFLLGISSTAIENQPSSIATHLKFGVWGFCATSDLHPTPPGTCSSPRLGYNVSSMVNLSDAGVPPAIVTVVEHALLVILVLHPIVAGLALVSAIFSLFLASHGLSIFTLFLTIVTALVGSVSMAIDLAIVIVARNRLPTSGITLSLAIEFGNGTWMVVTGVILTWIGVILLSARACYCLGVRRDRELDNLKKVLTNPRF